MKWTLGLFFYLTLGCMSFSTLQTARPLKPNELSGTLATGYQTFGIRRNTSTNNAGESNTSTAQEEETYEEFKLPILEAMAQYGVIKNLTLGLKVTFPGSYAFDGKYTIHNGEKFAFASGVNIGRFSLNADSTNAQDQKQNVTFAITDFSIPIHLSYDFNDYSAVYMSPRYTLRRVSVTTDYEDETLADKTEAIHASYAGISLGFHIGWFILEGSYLASLKAPDEGTTQVTAGIWFAWDQLDRPAKTLKTKKTKKNRKKKKSRSVEEEDG